MSEKKQALYPHKNPGRQRVAVGRENNYTGVYSAIKSIAYGWRVKVMVTGLWSE